MTQINKHIVEERDIIVDKRVTMLQYINTGILSLILGLASMIAVQLTSVKNNQATQQTEITRIKTIQDINTANISILDTRVKVLELNYTGIIKEWVDENYVRKPQR
jgi:hypothetical protein